MLEELLALDHAIADRDGLPLAFNLKSATRKLLVSILSQNEV
jgi:hypothetical protein